MDGKIIKAVKEDPLHRLSVKEWAKEDRPREKLMMKGPEALSNAELLAILIGSGNSKETAVDLMKRLLRDNNDSLAMLGKMSISDMMKYNGIGEAKAITLLAACELGKRRQHSSMPELPILDKPQNIYNLMHPIMRDLKVEESYLLLLKTNFQLISKIKLSQGGLAETAVDVRMVIKEALLAGATIIALVHNHPSGSISPSRNDDTLTNHILQACNTMRIHLADHVIITDGNYYSYRENGKL
jgi:DNA repair protein RadC